MKKTQNNQEPEKKLMGFLLPYRLLKQNNTKPLFLTILIMGFGGLVANMLALFFPLTLLQIYDRIVPNKALITLIVLAIAVVIALIFEAILRISQGSLSQWLDAKFQYLYGLKIMKSITEVPSSFYRKNGVGTYLEKVEQLQKLRNFYIGQALTSALNIPFLIVFLALIAYISYWIALAVVILIICVGCILALLAGSLRTNYQEKLALDAKLANFTIDTFQNIHYIKAQSLESQLLRRYEMLYQKKMMLNFQEWKMHALQLIQTAGNQVMTVFIAVVAAPLAIYDHLTVGGIAACIILASRCLQPLNAVTQVWIRLQTVKVAQKELSEVTDLPSEKQLAEVELIKPIDINMQNVSLKSAERSLLKDINLTIPANACVAIKGDDGLAKSSLLRLMLGDIDDYQGHVLINGKEITEINLMQIRKHITYLSREYNLYQDTIIDNITDYSAEKIEKAKVISTQLGLTRYVENLPDGFYTKLTEQLSLQLPRGVKQLINIVRGFVRDSEIILFDEANVYLSLQADEKLIKYLESLKHKKTLIIISERPSLLAIADHVYQLKNGRLEGVAHG